jgi:exodeoxyribonuclease V beta subunit
MTLQAFDLGGPLPSGVTVLEASAGTGKTFAIAGLTARYVAAGVPLERMLLVTFTRNATSELRDRVRERLISAHRHLSGGTGDGTELEDEVAALLAAGDPAEIADRRRLLARALADFDAATITTTHAFCQRMLASLGIASDPEGDMEVVADVDDLLTEVVDDRYLRRALVDAAPPFNRATALAVAHAAVANPRAVLAPADGGPQSPEGLRRRLATTVRAELEARKRRLGTVTYDDLLTRLEAALSDPETGAGAVRALRERYQVVLVDEFQDTDALQWKILSKAFRHPGSALVLIGDPKQAIYAFRGADVHAYLDAAGRADQIGTLTTNWRSDQGLLDAYNAIFAGARLGHPDIVCRPVEASTAHRSPGIDGPVSAPLRVRVVHRDDGLVSLTPKGFAGKPSTRVLIGRDLAADIGRLLSDGTVLVRRDAAGKETGTRPIGPGDIAVLTRMNRDAAAWQAALAGAGIPAVLNGAGSVFATAAATEWLQLLEALERPTSATRVHAVALTSFVGWSAAEVDAAGEERWEEQHGTCHRWAAVLRRSGVAALLETITASTGLPARVLAAAEGERHLTDIRHIGELLHAEATGANLGTAALTVWLRERIADARTDTDAEERSRRLESDSEAVQILTIHRSKGLEWPVVYFPDLWEAAWIPGGDAPVSYHDRDSGMERTIDVAGGRSPSFVRHQRWHEEEKRGEDLRLAYVALTRARHQAVVWWAGSEDSRRSPLGRLLFSRAPDGTIPAEGPRVPADADAEVRFSDLGRPGVVSVERVGRPAASRWSPPQRADPELAAAVFGRIIDRAWRRSSYTGLTTGAHEDLVSSEPEDETRGDEDPPEEPSSEARDASTAQSEPLPLSAMPGGARVGSLIHAVLEGVDFATSDLPGALREALAAAATRWQVAVGDPDVVVAGLAAAIATPLGAAAGAGRLRDLRRADRLDELAFELPVAGGDRARGEMDLGAVADLLERHLPAGDPLAAYPSRLRDPSLASSFRGFLTGSLDLVARLPAPGGGHHFVVADYKTNVLGREAAVLTARDYRPEALAEAMMHAHYPLQALLYSVALHRYLRWRVPGYEPGTHLGGVLYLFLRGMTGEAGAGVFAWRPSTDLVTGLSDLLHTGARP